MSVFSRSSITTKTKTVVVSESMAPRLGCARSRYKRVSEELFEVCYRIQVTGKLPDPVLLTNLLLQYREARSLVKILDNPIAESL